ncbi:MAG: MerR family transcriptional regulator [Aquabacterium sp.]
MNRPLMMSIAAVERDTGLSKDTLRIWERRYGFPDPVRDGQGERCYPMDQIERLRLIKRLLDVGHRPGRIVTLPTDDLQVLADRSADAQGLSRPAAPRLSPAPAEAPTRWAPDMANASAAHGLRPEAWLSVALQMIDRYDHTGLRHHLRRGLTTAGLLTFVADMAGPLMEQVGEGWLRGRFQIAQEHWVSQLVQQVIQGGLNALPDPSPMATPRVLLSTLPGEPHALGLLTVEAALSAWQALPVNLGPQTPLWDLVQTSTAHRADVVALGFGPAAPATLIQDLLPELRAKLPASVALWVGGRHPLLSRRQIAGVTVVGDLRHLSQTLEAWRQARRGT